MHDIQNPSLVMRADGDILVSGQFDKVNRDTGQPAGEAFETLGYTPGVDAGTGSVYGVVRWNYGTGTNPALENWQVFLDANGNGRFDFGEPTAYTESFPSGALSNTVNYHIMGVKPGTYKLYEMVKDGWQQNQPPGAPELSFTTTMRMASGIKETRVRLYGSSISI